MTTTRYKLKGPRAKLCVLSDFHCTKNTNIRKIHKIVESEKPDFIVIPGDLYSRHIYENCNSAAVDFLRFCSDAAPTFYAKGNHEGPLDETDLEIVSQCGVTYLNDTCVRHGDFVIGGLTSKIGYGMGNHKFALPDTDWLDDFKKQDGYHILLSHQPELIDYLPRDIDLILSGHAHGGQWRIFGRGVFAPGQGLFPKYTKGQYQNMIVSAGLANTALPIPRFFNPTEVVVIEFSE